MKKLVVFNLFLYLSIGAWAQNAGLVSVGTFSYSVKLKKAVTVDQARVRWWDEYLEFPENQTLLANLITGIREGKIPVMFPEAPLTHQASSLEAYHILVQSDTTYIDEYPNGVYDPKAATVLVPKLITELIEPCQIGALTFYEEWFFDESKLGFEKRIKGFSIDKYVEAQNGALFSRTSPLLYIPVNGKTECPIIIRNFLCRFTAKAIWLSENEETEANIKILFFIKRLAAVAERKMTPLYDTIFPFSNAVDKKKLNGLYQQFQEGVSISFLEDWGAEAKSNGFVKKVKGILFSSKPRNAEACPVSLAFLPLNSFVPEPMHFDQGYIPKISYNTCFLSGMANEYCPMIQGGDSALLQTPGINLANSAKRMEIPSFASSDDPWMENRVVNSSLEVHGHFFHTDSIEVLSDTSDFNSPLVAKGVTDECPLTSIVGYRFFESWKFDGNNGHFEKELKGLDINIPKYITDTPILYSLVNVDLAPIQDISSLVLPDYRIAKNIRYEVRIGLDSLNGDAGEYSTSFEKFFEYIYPSKRYKLVESILQAVREKKLKAYGTSDKEHKHPLKGEELLNAFKTFQIGATVSHVSGVSSEYLGVEDFEFNEDWYFNPASRQFYKKVNSITLKRFSLDLTDKDHPKNKEIILFTVVLKS
jgi:hypothetical protein